MNRLPQPCAPCALSTISNDTETKNQYLVPILSTLLISAIIGLILWLLSRER